MLVIAITILCLLQQLKNKLNSGVFQLHTRTNTVLSRALKPMMLKTCASHFHLRRPFTAVRYLELLSSPRAVHSSVQPLLVLSVTVHFGSGKSSAAPAWLLKRAPHLQPGRLSQCLVACAWQGTVTSQADWITPAWSPQEACLSLSRPSCHKCATLQLLESALLDQELFCCLCAASAAALSERVQRNGWGGSSLKGRCSPLCSPPSLGSP